MRVWKGIIVAAMLLAAYGLPAMAEANGEHIHLGNVHFDPIVGIGVGVFLGFITLMFVGQWVRFNAARRKAAGVAGVQEVPEEGEEAANGDGQEDSG